MQWTGPTLTAVVLLIFRDIRMRMLKSELTIKGFIAIHQQECSKDQVCRLLKKVITLKSNGQSDRYRSDGEVTCIWQPVSSGDTKTVEVVRYTNFVLVLF